jgi:hypothetical protein
VTATETASPSPDTIRVRVAVAVPGVGPLLGYEGDLRIETVTG